MAMIGATTRDILLILIWTNGVVCFPTVELRLPWANYTPSSWGVFQRNRAAPIGSDEFGLDGLAPGEPSPDCDPLKAPRVQLDWGNMNGDSPPFQAWRSTTDSVDLRFFPFPNGYTTTAWGPSCPWPLRFICIVKTTADRPQLKDMQQDGIGPGLGTQECTWSQASSMTNDIPNHCHVYIYNLESAGYLGIQYHSWCMACHGVNCSESTEDMIHPEPDKYAMKTLEDYNKVVAAMDFVGNQTILNKDIELSSGNVIKGYKMDDGCKCRIARTITGYKTGGAVHPVSDRNGIPKWQNNFEFILDDGLVFKTVQNSEHHHHVHGCTQVVVACVALIAYMCWGLFGLQRYFKLLHETGLATFIGYAIGFFKIYVAHDHSYVEFSFETMSFVVLPIVIFAAGFNFKKKSLFKYGSYILVYGFLGTLACFFGFYYIFRFGNSFPENSFATSKPGVNFEFDTKTCLILAAVLSCCDTVAPLTLINAATLPVLYAIVFGEAVINDVVGVLFNASVAHWEAAPSPMALFFDVGCLLVFSLLFGLVFGALISVLWARLDHLHEGTLQPVLLMMTMNYLCYAIAELMELSAIFSIFVCALVSSHYAIFSMDHEAQHFAHEASEMLAFLCESAMFVYFGYASVTYLSDHDRYPLCLPAVIYCTLAIVILRPLMLTLLTFFMQAGMGCKRLSVPFSTIFVFELCGCIRGTISYALILKHMPSFEYRDTQDQVLISTVLLVVNLTTVSFGCILPVAIKCLENSSNTVAPGGEEGANEGSESSASTSRASSFSGIVQEYTAALAQDASGSPAKETRRGTREAIRLASTEAQPDQRSSPEGGQAAARQRASMVGQIYARTANPFQGNEEVDKHHRIEFSPHVHHHDHEHDDFFHLIAHKWKHFDHKYVAPHLTRKHDSNEHLH